MLKRFLFFLSLFVELLVLSGTSAIAQEVSAPRINVKVDLVQLNVAVTDNKGNYITGLRPQDFVVTEDGISENVALFGEGDESVRTLLNPAPSGANSQDSPADRQNPGAAVPASELTSRLVAGADVFVLFD